LPTGLAYADRLTVVPPPGWDLSVVGKHKTGQTVPVNPTSVDALREH
jgi:hypothetical protein